MLGKKIVSVCNIIIIFMLVSLFILGMPFPALAVAAVNKDIIYNGNLNSNKVCLMINVYWGTEFVEPMMEIFKQYNFVATFFVGGMWAAKNTALLNLMIQNGHELGNHGFNHKDHTKISDSLNIKEIEMTHKVVLSNVNVAMTLFAPPSGAINKKTTDIATSLGYRTIMWTRDTIDWRDKNAELVFNRATKNIKGGDLILMHPTKHTLESLDRILAYIKNKHLVATTVSDCLN